MGRAAITALALASLHCATVRAVAQPVRSPDSLLTRAERTGFVETSRYEDVVAFLEVVAAASPRIHLTTFGYSLEGRPLPLAVVGDVPGADAEAVRTADRIRIYLQGNIHAGEVCGKEALLMLLRSLARGEHAEWWDSAVLLVAPIYNPDGNERIRLTNRPRQHGPLGGMGQRANALGLDLNRDHTKLESPESRSLARLLNRYDPHLAVDLHTTDGTRHAYHLTYAPPLHPNTAPSIDDFLRRELLPAVTRSVREKHGWELYYYGNLPWREGVERGWYTYDHRPRFNTNYVGLRNRLGVLGEAYAYAPFRERVLASLYLVEEIVSFAANHAGTVHAAVRAAQDRPIAGRELAVRAAVRRSTEPVEILLGEVREERNPYSGAVILRRLDVSRPERMYEYGSFRPTETERVPTFYLVPADLEAVVERLKAHGIGLRPLEAEIQPGEAGSEPGETAVELEVFAIDSTWTATREYQGHRQRTVTGEWRRSKRGVEAGTLVVPTAQPLGRLAFTLLEPRSDDGFASWNLLDRALEDAEVYPILRGVGPIP